MITYTEARARLARHLEWDAAAHQEGRFEEIGRGYDPLEGEMPQGSDPAFAKLWIALNFWDGWIDARNHGWRYYEGIDRDAWPVLARAIARDLTEDRDIMSPVVRDRFGPRPGTPLRVKFANPLRWFFRGGGSSDT